MADLTRRAFLGKTLLTGATIAVGVLPTTSTTPIKAVAPATTTWKNLNVLSPKAKAYRTFLRGIVGGAEIYQKDRPTGRQRTSVKTVLTKHVSHNSETGNIEKVKTSYGRNAFETAIKKPEGSWTKVEASQGVGNPGARNLAISMKTNTREMKQGFMDPKNTSAGKESRTLTARITKAARQEYAQELRNAQEHKVGERMYKKKRRGYVRGYGGGGGKSALPGLESARNPTGMSLLDRKSVLM